MRTYRSDKTRRMTLRMTEDLANALEKASKQAGISQNSFVCVAIQRLAGGKMSIDEIITRQEELADCISSIITSGMQPEDEVSVLKFKN